MECYSFILISYISLAYLKAQWGVLIKQYITCKYFLYLIFVWISFSFKCGKWCFSFMLCTEQRKLRVEMCHLSSKTNHLIVTLNKSVKVRIAIEPDVVLWNISEIEQCIFSCLHFWACRKHYDNQMFLFFSIISFMLQWT